jgi:hypothetical protein
LCEFVPGNFEFLAVKALVELARKPAFAAPLFFIPSNDLALGISTVTFVLRRGSRKPPIIMQTLIVLALRQLGHHF